MFFLSHSNSTSTRVGICNALAWGDHQWFSLSILVHLSDLPLQDEELRDSRSDSEDDTMSESDHDAVLDLNKVPVKNAGKAGTNGLVDDNFPISSIEHSKDIVAQDLK